MSDQYESVEDIKRNLLFANVNEDDIIEKCKELSEAERTSLYEECGFTQNLNETPGKIIVNFAWHIMVQRNAKALASGLIYHVTPKRNLRSILEQGLKPKIGARSKELGEPEAAVYCFPTREDCDTALGSWLGECFSENCSLVILEIALDPDANIKSDVAYEIACIDIIPVAAIVNCYDEAWDEMDISSYKPNLIFNLEAMGDSLDESNKLSGLKIG